MAQVIADRRDVDFVLFEQLGVEQLNTHPPFADFSRKAMDLVINEARNLAIKEMLPTQKEGDQQGCTFDSGRVTAPESFKRAWDLLVEGEWLALTEDAQVGGQGMPRTLAMAVGDYLNGANQALMMYGALTHGAGMLVKSFGSDKVKALFLKKLFSGRWTGTMMLTEPEAGSDVGLLSTAAEKNADGTYTLTGNKIFISSGEHDLSENIVHPTLARIQGAPAGTKGISLFLVPKYWVKDDGSLGEPNDVVCTGIEEKMGIHGNATCSITLGGKGRCRGYLLGEENGGMRAMFLMMNEARLLVGMQGLACASASYLNAVQYARQRFQGRHLTQARTGDAPAVPIIEHPDVRRMLITMKAYVEGMRSLLYYTGMLFDRIHVSGDDKEKARLQGMIDVLIPVCKGYVTDRAFDVCNLGLQVYGGYGYIREYPQEQLVRDCRVTMIYEGTNGIQAMDLLGRKLGQSGGKPIMDVMAEIQVTLAQARNHPALTPLAENLGAALNRLGQTAMQIGADAASAKVMTAFAFAGPFLDVCGDVVLAWMLLWRAVVAQQRIQGQAAKKDLAFYMGQVKTAQFFIQAMLPVTMGKMKAIMAGSPAAVEIEADGFGGK